MRGYISICVLLLTLSFGCRTSIDGLIVGHGPVTIIDTTNESGGAIVQGMAINIDGTLWHADTYAIQQMGTFWVIKGSASDTSVFSIMVPEIQGEQSYKVLQGGEVSVTYSTSRAKGFLFFAPFAENNGWIKTTVADGYLKGTLEVTISNGAVQKICTGMFIIKLP